MARNTAINFLGQLLPLVVGVVTIPLIVQGLGPERFGILSVAWVVLGYFSLFDLGLGRATTKFVAEYLGRGDVDRLSGLIWTSMTFHLLLGAVGGALLAAFVPLLVGRVLNIPAALAAEAKGTFFILAASVPIVLGTMTLRGALEAGQRFDLVNAVKVPASVLTLVIPASAAPLGLDLPAIAFLLVLTILAAALVYFVLCVRVFPSVKRAYSFNAQVLRPVFTFGGWVTVTNIVGPVLVYLDRFLIGSLLSMSAVAYYTAPYDVIIRLQVLSVSLAITLFPTFSALEAMGDRERLGRLYARSVKFIFLTLGPAIILLVLYADEALRFWLGDVFARESAPVLRLLGLGVFVNSLAHVPYTLLQGAGRPDIPAKFHLMELPFYAALAWVLIATWGITGAALAWTLRVVVDAVLLFVASWKVFGLPQRVLAENGFSGSLISVAALGVGLLPLTLQSWGPVVQAMVAGVLVAGFAGGVWRYVLESVEKDAVLSMLKQLYSMNRGE